MTSLRRARVAAAPAVTCSSALRTTIASGSFVNGMRATVVPDFGIVSTRPSAASRSSASRTGVRLTRCASAMSFSMMGSPGLRWSQTIS